MICIPCNGSGLINQHKVCPECKGVGHDGVPEVTPTFAEKVKTTVKKVKKVVKKKK